MADLAAPRSTSWQGQPHESHVAGAVRETDRGVEPRDPPQHGPGAGLAGMGESRAQQVATDSGLDADDQRRLGRSCARGPPGVRPRREQRPRLRKQRLACCGESYSAPVPLQQAKAELPFQGRHLLADRRLGDEQPLGGAPERQLFGDRDESVRRSRG